MKCLVTGAAGFIGSHLCERLINDGHEVTGIDSLISGSKKNLAVILDAKRFEFQSKGIFTWQADGTYDWVFHLAARADIVPSIQDPLEYHQANVSGTVTMLEKAREAGAKRFIYAASSSCYGIPDEYPTLETAPCHPMYPYALTKYLGEQYVTHWNRVYQLPTVSLRLFNVYGPRSRTNGTYGAVFGTFLSQLAHNKPLTVVGDGTQARDFTFVTDVVDAFVRAAESDVSDVILNIGTGKPQTINHLIELLGAKDIVRIPERPGEPKITCAHNYWAEKVLEWSPKVSFEEGVAIMKELIPEYKDAPLWTPEKIAKATEAWFEHL